MRHMQQCVLHDRTCSSGQIVVGGQDDRRGSERKAARFHFNLKSKDNLLDKEKSSCRENTMKSRVLEQEGFGAPGFDTGSNRTHAESRLTQAVPRYTSGHGGEDILRNAAPAIVLPASKAAKEGRQHCLQAPLPLDSATASQLSSPPLLDNEHKPLSSASQARTSLRSQVRSRAGSGKERFRVSFSEGPSLDFSGGDREMGQKQDILDLGQDASATRSTTLKSTQSELPNRDLRLDNYEHLYFPYSAHYRELIQKLHNERKVADDICNYTSRFANDFLATSCGQFLGQHLEMESSPASSLKLNSDAKPKSPFLSLAHSASTSFGDFLSKHVPLPSEAPLENSPPVSSLTSVPRKGQEPPACRSLSPSRVEFKHAPVTPKPCFQEPGMKHRYSEWSNLCVPAAEGPVSTEKSSPVVVVVLHQLVELVDRYWAGSGSLLLNKEFLALARDLLAQLMTLAPSQQDVSSAGVATPGSNSAGINCKFQPKHTQHCKRIGRPAQKQAENQVSSFKEQDLEAAATFRVSPHRVCSLSYDELLNRNEVLSAQVDVLSLELKQLKKQQETISLLRESQRSLVSTNNFLLQQLTREHSPSSGKAALRSGKVATAGSASFCKTLAPPAPLSSAFGSDPLCGSEQL